MMLTLDDIAKVDARADIYTDLHKDVYGFRGTGHRFASLEAFSADWDRMVESLEYQQAAEREQQKAASERFEQRVLETIDLGAADRTAAIQWIMQAEDADDLDELEYRLHLPYGYLLKETVQ